MGFGTPHIFYFPPFELTTNLLRKPLIGMKHQKQLEPYGWAGFLSCGWRRWFVRKEWKENEKTHII